jgi:hypothetical protein
VRGGVGLEGIDTLMPRPTTLYSIFCNICCRLSCVVPGEVTAAELVAEIDGTSANSNAVATLDTPFADADDEVIRAKINELVLALRR